MKSLIKLSIVLGIVLQTVSCANILVLLPVASKSHVHVFEPLVRALGEKGHNIVSFTSQASKNMPPSVKEIVIVPVAEIFKTMDSPFKLRQVGKVAQMTNMSTEYLETTCKAVLNSKEIEHLIAHEKFDLVVIDILMNSCLLGLLHYVKAPYIYVSTMAAPSFLVEPLGNRLPPSFVPAPFLSFSHRMTFFERLINFSFNAFMDVVGYFHWIPTLQKFYQEKFGISTTIFDYDRNVSMVLVNSHFALTYPRPNLPDVIDVGGMHANPSKPLPKDLEDFISGAEHGCIYFSLGSIAQGKDMPEEYRKVFVNVFSKLKQRVLWKWETDTMPDLPKNVKLIQWAPQQDILGHKNIKLFMTHGGLLSIQETVYHGVPLLGFALFADQDLNIKQAEKAGFALSLEILQLNEQTLESKLEEVLSNPSYKNRVKELSTIWRDQPKTPLETAVFWTEYVIRHKGAHHLRSAARDLNFFQYHSLDVIAFLASLILGSLFITFKILKCVFKRLCCKDNWKKTKHAKKVISSKKSN